MSGAAESVLASLDEWQREAAMALTGPVAILAGAGSGKTRTITHRIAYGVATGTYDPELVLAVTFTRKAAGEMQARLRNLNVRGVRTQTFHAAALSQLRHYWPQAVQTDMPRVLAGKSSLISQALDSVGVRHDPELVLDIATEIEWRKVTLRSLEDYEAALPERVLPPQMTPDQVLRVLDQYETLKIERRMIDFEDVLTLMTGMMQAEPAVAQEIRRRARFFTVDEFQDVSPLQFALLQEWLGQRNDVCVVGDPSQTIYSFTGASSEYLIRFGSEFAGAQEFRLEQNYRSTPQIISIANHVIQGRPGALTLVPVRESGPAISPVAWFVNETREAQEVAADIRRRIQNGTPAGSMAILTRTTSSHDFFRKHLAVEGVATRIQGEMGGFDYAQVLKVMALLRASALASSQVSAKIEVDRSFEEAGWRATPPDSIAERGEWYAMEALHRYVHAELENQRTLKEITEELRRRKNVGDELPVNLVTVSTVHSAKGLEWPNVYITGLGDGVFPIHYAETEAELAEERRLFYVALTRAETDLRLSGYGSRGHERVQASPFIREAGLKTREIA